MAVSEEPSGPEQQGATELNLGVKLRYAREAQALSLDDVAAELRISAQALLALEECRFDAVGPPVFAKGYLKQYSARLGLDVKDILADYERAKGAERVDIAPSRSIKMRDERQIAVWVIAAVMLAVLTVLLLIWWLRQPGQLWGPPETALSTQMPIDSGSSQASESSEVDSVLAGEVPVSTRPSELPPREAPPAATSPAATSPAETALVETAPAETAVGETPVADRAPQPVAEPGSPENEAETTRVAANPAQSVGARPNSATNTAPANTTLATDAATGESAVEVAFVEDSWAEITAASGDQLFYRLGEAGTTARFPADNDLRFFFGNAGGVEIRLDGAVVAIPTSARRGDLAQFVLGDLRD